MTPSLETNCWNCKRTLGPSDYGRGDICPGCRRDTRVCKNCVHHDPSYNNQCKENQADRVLEKERSNFCDYFSAGASGGKAGATSDLLRAAADALFKKK